MRIINESSERKKEKKKNKKERIQKYFFPFFSVCIYENELAESANLLIFFF